MTNLELGYTQNLENFRITENLSHFKVARITSEHKDRFTVKNETNEFEAEIIGNLRFNAINRKDLPAVGDWVAISEYDNNKALIHAVFPRKSIIERKAVGLNGKAQIIATNIDFGLIVQSVNRDFSLNRIERYLTICYNSKIEPIVILSKVDLISETELNDYISTLKDRLKNVLIFAISNHTKTGIEEIKQSLVIGKTYCLLGSSGVGKSTLINTLAGTKTMNTGEISQSIDRGKHITSHRELIVLENGILIDNPGMREIGLTDISGGIEMTFEEIYRLTQDCKFSDCSHTNEKDCAILIALENEEIDENAYANFQKMEREREFFEASVTEKKQSDKDLAKLIRQNKKRRGNNKY